MMSLNSADALRRKLEDEHDFNAEQGNGTLMIVDAMVENGFDRMAQEIASLRSDMAKDITSLRSDMDARFNVIDDRLKNIENWLPYKSALLMIAVVAAYAAIFGT